MLIQFVVENFLSFQEATVFSMVATKDTAHPSHLITTEGKRTLVRGAAIYGANASGKSNLIHAMRFAQRQIWEGNKPNEKIPLKPFKLAEEVAKSSFFQFTFLVGGVEYDYGFHLQETHVEQEFLYTRPNGRTIKYYERTTTLADTGRYQTKVEFGSRFKPKSQKLKSFVEYKITDTRPNQLFLNTLAGGNIPEGLEGLFAITAWFSFVLEIHQSETPVGQVFTYLSMSSLIRDFLVDLLNSVGTGITGIQIVEKPAEFKGETTRLPPLEGIKVVTLDLLLEHKTETGKTAFLNVVDESDGTKRLISLIPIIYDLKDHNEKVFVIDELDLHLHTRLSRGIINLILSESANNQLIFTTHDTNLLDPKLLRKDEIWFVEKNEDGASELYPLTDFELTRELNLEKGYLNGRFGAIPLIRQMKPSTPTEEPKETVHA